MFGSKDKNLPSGWKFRDMKESEIPTALSIIEEHDEDDAEWAQETYSERGTMNQFVLANRDGVQGVTGYAPALGTAGSFWISWTYLRGNLQGQGYGTMMLECLTNRVKENYGRKLFVSTSDYTDPTGKMAYIEALACYQKAGFQKELIHTDYYRIGESQIILGHEIPNVNPSNHPSLTSQDNQRKIVITEIFPVDEADDVFAVDWDYDDDRPHFGPNDLTPAIDDARRQGGRVLFCSFPSDHGHVGSPMSQAGFNEAGRLKDFFGGGVDEVHYRLDL